jgi:hypothetical protein
MIRTFNDKYQKFMTYRLVHEIKKSNIIIFFTSDGIWTRKAKSPSSLSTSCLPIPSHSIENIFARYKIWTYNLNIFRVPLYRVELIELKKVLETSGLDPEITICKIAVLPVKLCPLKKNFFFIYPKEDLNLYDISQRSLSSPCLPIPALGLYITKAKVNRTLT